MKRKYIIYEEMLEKFCRKIENLERMNESLMQCKLYDF